MEGDLTQFIGLAGVPFIIALVEAAKWILGQKEDGSDRLPKEAVPALDLVLGAAINVGLAYYQHLPLVPGFFLGLVAGLTAAGLYSGAKALIGR